MDFSLFAVTSCTQRLLGLNKSLGNAVEKRNSCISSSRGTYLPYLGTAIKHYSTRIRKKREPIIIKMNLTIDIIVI